MIVFFLVALTVFAVSSFETNAEEFSEFKRNMDSLMDGLSDEVKQDLTSLEIDSANINDISNIGFDEILDLVVKKLTQAGKTPLSASAVVIAVLILNALFESYTDALKYSQTKEVFSVISTLTITTTLVLPIIDLINDSIATVNDASNFMLVYIPIMVAILTYSGHAVSSASYYSFMVLACQGVSQVSTKIISPLLNVYLSLCVSSSISDKINLRGVCQMFSKVIKWLLSFSMTIFSALMTIRGMITTAYDSVSARAVRFTMSSFIPIVGAALAESYKTIQGSVNLLRTGAGVFVILAIFVVFLPCICRCFVWLLSINICKTIGELISSSSAINMLGSVSSVISTVFAIIVCIMAVFIISTALMITLGGGSV